MDDMIGYVRNEAERRFRELGLELTETRRLVRLTIDENLDAAERPDVSALRVDAYRLLKVGAASDPHGKEWFIDLDAAEAAGDPKGYLDEHLDLIVGDARRHFGLPLPAAADEEPASPR